MSQTGFVHAVLPDEQYVQQFVRAAAAVWEHIERFGSESTDPAIVMERGRRLSDENIAWNFGKEAIRRWLARVV